MAWCARRRRAMRGQQIGRAKNPGRSPVTTRTMIETMQAHAKRGRRGRGRAARASRRPVVARATCIRRGLGPLEILDVEGLELIERNADEILREIGMEFRGDPRDPCDLPRRPAPTWTASACASSRGCAAASSGRVRRASSPSTLATPRTPSGSAVNTPCSAPHGARHSCTISISVGATPPSTTSAGSCRSTTRSPYLHHSGGIVCEPVDIPPDQRHLDMLYHHIRYSDRPLHGSVHRAGAGAGRGGHGEDRVRRGLPARPRLPLRREQHQCAARPRCVDVRLPQDLRAPQPAGGVHTVDARRGHESVHRRRDARPSPRRGARDALSRAARQPRRPPA